jgi:hypothetical protein
MSVLANIASGVFLAITIAVSYYYINKAQTTDWMPYLRRLPAIDAMEEAVGRAVEMGRPILVSPAACGTIRNSANGPVILAGVTVINYVARMAAQRGAELVATIHESPLVPIVEDAIESAYRMEGVFDEWNPENIRFLGGTQQSYITGQLGLIAREKPAAQIAIGYFCVSLVTIAEAGSIAGLMQIGGTTNTYQFPYLVSSFDYWLIGDDCFAVGAFLSREPLQASTIYGEDMVKFLVIAMILFGSVLSMLGIDFFTNLLNI